MIDDTLLNQLPKRAAIMRGAKLCDYTTFKLGGACPALIDCPDAQSLVATAELLHGQSVDFLVIGQGSNLLVADAGIGAVVLRYTVRADGKPYNVKIKRSTLDDAAVEKCMVGVGKKLRFPARTGRKPTKVVYPFRYAPAP